MKYPILRSAAPTGAALVCLRNFFTRWLRTATGCAIALVAITTMQAAQAEGRSGNDDHKTRHLPQFLIVDYHPISKTLVAGSPAHKPLYDYAYRVDVRNSGNAVADVTAEVTNKHKAQQIIQDQVHFGAVAAKRTQTSNDAFIVRANCRFDTRLDPKETSRKKSLCGDKDDHDEDDEHDDNHRGRDYTDKFNRLFDWKFHTSVVSAAPKISAYLPVGVINQVAPAISATFQDAGGGIAPASATLTIDGTDVSGQVAFTNTGFTYQPAPLADGTHQIGLTVPDLAGNIAQASWSFTIDTAVPGITGMAPKDITTTNPLAPIGAQFADLGVGIDPASVNLSVDGLDVTAQSVLTATGISYTPTTKLGDGDHIVLLALSDRAGNSTNATWHFQIDQTGPAVTAMLPINNTELPADSLPTISASVAGATGGTLTLELDGQNISAQAQISATGISYTPSTALPEGNHTVKLSVTDQYGNLTVTTWAFITRTAPVITSVAPQDITLNAQAPATITAQYSDIGAGVDPTKIVLLLDTVDVTSQAQITATGLTLATSAVLPQGVHIATLTIADKAGNSATTTWRFTVYTGLPVITGMTPQDILLALGTPTISAQYQDSGDPAIAPGIDTASVKLTLDGIDITATAQVTATGISYTPPQALIDGLHIVKLSITDKVANTVNSTWSFVTDTGKPTIAISFTPADGAVLAADALPSITAQYVGSITGVDTANVRLELDTQNVTTQSQITDTDISYTPALPLSEGQHTVKLSVPNKAGTVTEQGWSFKTQSAPVITYVVPKDITLNTQAPATILAQYSDIGAGIDTTQTVLLLDTVDVTAQAQITDTGVTLATTAVLPEGVHTATLTIADKAGNSTTTTWNFTVYAGAPVISNLAPQNILLPLGTPTISAQYQDSGDPAIAPGIDTASVRLLVDGIDVTATAQVTATGISYLPIQTLIDGPHTVNLSVTDKAANTTEATWNFITDTGKPIIANFAPAESTILAADALPTISAQYQEAISGIDTANVMLEIDAQNVTAQAQITDTGISYTPTLPLAEGLHLVKLSVPSKVGTISVQNWTFTTATNPVISAQDPIDIFLPGGAMPVISASYSDVGSGIDPSKVTLQLDGVNVTAQAVISATGIQYTVPQPLPDLTHQVTLVVADIAGNTTSSNWQFGTATPPQITATTPMDVLLPPGSIPTISASFLDTGSGIDTASVLMMVNNQDVTSQANITATGISYTPTQALTSGPYTVYLSVGNTTNATVSAVWGFEVDVQHIYNVTITNPAGGQSVITQNLAVTATAYANKSYPTRLTLNGVEMSVTGTGTDGTVTYSGTINLIDGNNTLAVVGTFADGTTSSASTDVFFDAPATLTITSPADQATLGAINGTSPRDLTGNVERPVTITGHTSKPVQSVTINQQGATLSGDGMQFSFPDFFLREGNNLLTAAATDAQGRVSTAAISVSVDQTAPIINIEYPRPGYTTRKAWIDVRGMVNDAVEGMFGAPEPQLTVNGVDAQVADRFFQISDVPLQQGINTLTIRATDHLGNVREQTLQVIRADLGLEGLILESGHNQTGLSNTELPAPLSVLALNDKGEPVPNLAVNFEVLRGTGSVSPTQGQSASGDPHYTSRIIQINTDNDGRAQAWYTVGKQSGPGANTVRASAIGYSEDALFTANTQRGAVARISGDFGVNQISETGVPAMEILSAVVRDADSNPLPNVAVKFIIDEGQAYFTDTPGVPAAADGQSITVFSDKNGVVAARPTLGNTPGTVQISAVALKTPNGDFSNSVDTIGGATYIIRAKAAQVGPATFNGTLYTDKGAPLAGARVSIGRTPLQVTSDANGYFELNDVPPGRIDLFVDGRTANPTNDPARPQYPSLHFEAYVVRGQINQLPHPIYLPPLLASEAKIVGGNQDVILTMPGLEGFQMKVKANSVTFPDGSRVGTLIVSPVAADRLPMAPPAGGAQFGIPAWTVQPAGTRFDPPIEVQMPNTTGETPGYNLPVVQWDHDLAQYVPMGRATVTSDGAYLITDVGSGLTKAGWGGLCRYDPCKVALANKCPDCWKLSSEALIFECPKCNIWDKLNVNSARVSRPFSFTVDKWGPGKALEDLISAAFGAEVALKLNVVGQKIDWAECCDQTKSKQNILSGQVGAQGEASALFNVNGAGVVGRALYVAGLKAGVKGKVNATMQVSAEVHDCPMSSPAEKERWDIQGTLGGGLELEVKVGELGSFTVMGFAGAAGVEVQGQIITNRTPNRPDFDIKSAINVYVQGDVVLLNQKVTGIRLQIPLIVNSQASARVLFP